MVFTQTVLRTEVLRTEGFTHNCFLHTDVFLIYTQMPLHERRIAHRHLCTQHTLTRNQLLHREVLLPLLDHLPFVFPLSSMIYILIHLDPAFFSNNPLVAFPALRQLAADKTGPPSRALLAVPFVGKDCVCFPMGRHQGGKKCFSQFHTRSDDKTVQDSTRSSLPLSQEIKKHEQFSLCYVFLKVLILSG